MTSTSEVSRPTPDTQELGRWMRRNYFSFASGALLLLSVWGFSDNLLWRVDQPSNSDPKFVVHGLFCLLWMILLFAQASLVRSGRTRIHRKLGIAAFLTSIGVTASTAYVFVAVAKPWHSMDFYIQANRLLLPGYGLLVLLGYLERRRPEWHKRYVLMASLYMLEPVLSRAFDPIDALLTGFTESQIDTAWWIFFLVTWNGLVLSLLLHDRAVSGRIHPATFHGALLFYAIWAAVLIF